MRAAKSNLTREEQRGLRSLKGSENVVVYQTDKSGRFAVDTKDNYRVACMVLVQKIGNSIHSSIELEIDYPSRHVRMVSYPY